MNGQGVNIGSMSGDDDQEGARTMKKYRHTTEQIQELENFYRHCPLPDVDQRFELGQMLNLEPNQIKFWFQNKRNKTKMQRKRGENRALTEEHNRLRGYQEQLKHAMLHSSCISCRRPINMGDIDFEVQKLIVENATLKREVNRLENCLASSMKFTVTPPKALPSSSSSSLVIYNPGRNAPPEPTLGGGTITMNETSMYLELATVAMKELRMLGKMDCPFWTTNSISKKESLNYEEFISAFHISIKPPGYVMEASREMGLVFMTSLALVKTLMDTEKWVDVFASIVSVASVHKVIPTGFGAARNGSLLEIQAEYQIVSPLVPKRETKFLRYCKELRRGLWVIVDVTPTQEKLSCGDCSRLPSGLIIEDMANGYSRVTWIEQAGYDESHTQQLCRHMIGSGGLGAKRWLTTLQRHSETLSTFTSINMAQICPGLPSKGAKEIVRLAQRMVLNYYTGINASSVVKWERIHAHNIKLMIQRNVNEPGEHTGVKLSASTSAWFPMRQQTVFDFISNPSCRHQWDVLTHNTSMERAIHIQKAKRHGNCISLLRNLENGMLVLEEIWNDASGALVVYAPLETNSIEEVMKGEDAENVQILPCGFSICPENETSGGCLLTLGLQFLVNSNPTAQLTQRYVELVEELMATTIGKIKTSLGVQI